MPISQAIEINAEGRLKNVAPKYLNGAPCYIDEIRNDNLVVRIAGVRKPMTIRKDQFVIPTAAELKLERKLMGR